GQSLSYQVAGRVYFLSRPLKGLATALHESSIDWKTPARAARNALYSALPAPHLPAGYEFTQVAATDIPHQLWPRPTAEVAVTARTAGLMQHFASCPVLRQPMFFLLSREGKALAYFFLAAAGNQVRVADYGPAWLDDSNAKALGM